MADARRVECGLEHLMKQAPDVVQFYLKKTVEMVDDEFGLGYAKTNPALISSLVLASTKNFQADIQLVIAQDHIGPSLDAIAEAIRDLADK